MKYWIYMGWALLVPAAAAQPPAATLNEAEDPASEAPADAPHDATAALLDVLQRAIEHGPAVVGLRLRLADAALAIEADVAADSPRIGWQRVGIDSSLGRAANATDYWRISSAFNDPWQRAAARELERRQDDWARFATHAGLLDVVADAARAWLDWAAARAELSIVESRLAHVERILLLQEKKYELGEVAGAEVEQLQFEHARNTAAVRRADTRVQAARADLVVLVGGPTEAPAFATLEALVAEMGGDELPITDAAAGSVPVDMAQAWAAAEVARARWRRTLAWGRPEGEIEWERVGDMDGTGGFDAFGVHVSVPLRMGRGGRARRAHAEVAEAVARADAERTRLVSDRRRAVAQAEVDAATTNLASFADLLARIPTVERSLTERFRLGALSYLALIDGLSRLDDLRRDAIEARRALLVARLELAVLTGDPNLFPLPALETP